MQQHAAEYQRQNIAIFAVCPEPVDLLTDFVARHGITYHLLSDEGSRLIREVGILNTGVAASDPVYGVPYPGSYLVDEGGIVFEKRFHPDFHVREPMGSLLLYFQLKEYSERLKRKVQERTMQLIETAKLATMGKLIAVINHELNTPLGALGSGMELLWNHFESACGDLPSRQRAALEEIHQAVDTAYRRIVQVVTDLRQFIRMDQAEQQPVDLRQSLDAAVELLGSKIDGRIRVRRDYAEVPEISCHAPQVNQALWELLSNAIESIEGEGVLSLGVRLEGHEIVLTITDAGRGIPPQELGQLFEPRLRPKGGRMGVSLGLPLAYKVVHDHGGQVQVASRVGEGTSVTIRLPVAS